MSSINYHFGNLSCSDIGSVSERKVTFAKTFESIFNKYNFQSISYDEIDKINGALSKLEIVSSRATSLLTKIPNKTIVEKILSDDFSETTLSDKKEKMMASHLFVGKGNREVDNEKGDLLMDTKEPDVKEYILRNNYSLPYEGELREVPHRMYAYIGENEFRASFAISNDDANY